MVPDVAVKAVGPSVVPEADVLAVGILEGGDEVLGGGFVFVVGGGSGDLLDCFEEIAASLGE